MTTSMPRRAISSPGRGPPNHAIRDIPSGILPLSGSCHPMTFLPLAQTCSATFATRYDCIPETPLIPSRSIRALHSGHSAYAASLGITVVPEIDLPGHMLSALAAYPELGCRGGAYKVWGRWGISKDVLCVGKDTTFDFIEGVMDEIMEVFPGTYIHIGGDECPKIAWKTCPRCQERIRSLGITWDGVHTPEQLLQNYVTARVQKYLAEHGRRIIGWDEILEGNLSPGAIIMSWRGVSGGLEAAAKGFDVVMTPCDYLYLDYFQSAHADKEPLGIGGRLPIEKVYSFEPYDGLPEDARPHILGVQANLWTEYIATVEHLEYNLLPRMLAVSEVQWCAPGRRDFDRFKGLVLSRQFPMLDAMGRNYSRAIEGIYGMSRGNAAD